jgi:hypothetical protein
MTRGIHSALFASILTAVLGLGACTVPDPCDPGSKYTHGVCMTPTLDSGTGGDGDGDDDGDEDGGTDRDAAAEDAAVEPMSELICPAGGDPSVYGRECTTNDDCACPAAVCLGPLRICSGTQCMDPGRECPEDKTCTDIRPFRDMASFTVPDEVTHVCL